MIKLKMDFALKFIILCFLTAFSVSGFSSNTSNKEAQQILLAAQKGELNKLKGLLAKAVKPIWLSDPKFTATSHSILSCRHRNVNQVAVLKLLSDHGVDFNYPTRSGDGLLRVSSCGPDEIARNQTSLESQANTVEIAKFLISKGADPKRDYGRELTALSSAIVSENEPLAIFLLDYSDLREWDVKLAKVGGLSKFISSAISSKRDLHNQPIFRWALQSHETDEYHDNVVIALLNQGFDPNVFLTNNGFYQHPIAMATARGNLKAVERLILYGARINVTDAHGRNLLDIAKRYSHQDIVKFYESLGLTPSTDKG